MDAVQAEAIIDELGEPELAEQVRELLLAYPGSVELVLGDALRIRRAFVVGMPLKAFSAPGLVNELRLLARQRGEITVTLEPGDARPKAKIELRPALRGTADRPRGQ
jgi:hypothetical protein